MKNQNQNLIAEQNGRLPSRYCPGCNLFVAPNDPRAIIVESGRAHRGCVIARTMYCPGCDLELNPADTSIIVLDSGMRHLKCAIAKAIEMLVAAGLPEPTGCCTIPSLLTFFEQQAVLLSRLPIPEALPKISAIHRASDFLAVPLVDWSTIMRNAQSAATAIY